MLRLAVATNKQTYERMQDPLAERGIAAEYVQTAERTIPLDADFGAFDAGFVFPPRLAEGGVVSELLGVPWVNGREAILRSRHKGEALARLSRAGLPTPETVVVSDPVDESDLAEAFERFDPPVVVKPNAVTRGVGVAKAADLDSFLGICDYLDLVHDYKATGDNSFLVQEYLPDARDFRAMCLDGEYVGAVERRLPEDALDAGQWKHNVHRGAEATGIELSADHRALVERAAAAMDISFLGIDLLVTDDRVVVNETNARPTIDTATKYEDGFYDDLAGLIRQTVADG
ncbi:ATP-grasp domain-containing protein [Salinibaculum rarum]|uniref:ATP-grasp domain-containing protein n=1 Tax=Salinibaculum rarum TaxID=3058903 RepID=UPI00265E6479|nr:RimK family alpha-L-glutamate ligase [Salinibaculum sp. KK48]